MSERPSLGITLVMVAVFACLIIWALAHDSVGDRVKRLEDAARVR